MLDRQPHIAIAFLALFSALALPRAAGDERSSAFQVLEFRGLKDARRKDRNVPIKVYLPEGQGKHPLAIYSHGGAGAWDAHQYEAEHLARRGYVVFCLEHVRSNNVRVKQLVRHERGRLRDRFKSALARIVADPQAVLERPRDVSFAIDRAIEWNEKHKELGGRILTGKIAVLGHSFGAYTALAVCGARPILDFLDPPVKPGKGLAGDLSDARVTIGVAMSPQGTGTTRFGRDSFKTIRRPLLMFSGSKDEQLGHDSRMQPPERRLEAFELMPAGDKYFLWLENADHMSFAHNPKSRLFPSPAREDAMRIVRAMTTVFLDAHLRGDQAARALLTRQHASRFLGQVVTKIVWRQK